MHLFFTISSNKRIEFMDLTKINKKVYECSVSPHWPSKLHTTSPSTLLYSDKSHPKIIRWLDCSSSTPEPATGNNEMPTEQNYLNDLCCVENEKKSVVVTTDYYHSTIRCYSKDSGKLLWKVEGKLPGMGEQMKPDGITTDGEGLLFVTDLKNKCIHQFSADGEYVGVLLRKGEEGLGFPGCVQWNETNSSLVVAHVKDGQMHISVVCIL